jgi:hypothetical protein
VTTPLRLNPDPAAGASSARAYRLEPRRGLRSFAPVESGRPGHANPVERGRAKGAAMAESPPRVGLRTSRNRLRSRKRRGMAVGSRSACRRNSRETGRFSLAGRCRGWGERENRPCEARRRESFSTGSKIVSHPPGRAHAIRLLNGDPADEGGARTRQSRRAGEQNQRPRAFERGHDRAGQHLAGGISDSLRGNA